LDRGEEVTVAIGDRLRNEAFAKPVLNAVFFSLIINALENSFKIFLKKFAVSK
jgi:hypothetical protein